MARESALCIAIFSMPIRRRIANLNLKLKQIKQNIRKRNARWCGFSSHTVDPKEQLYHLGRFWRNITQSSIASGCVALFLIVYNCMRLQIENRATRIGAKNPSCARARNSLLSVALHNHKLKLLAWKKVGFPFRPFPFIASVANAPNRKMPYQIWNISPTPTIDTPICPPAIMFLTISFARFAIFFAINVCDPVKQHEKREEMYHFRFYLCECDVITAANADYMHNLCSSLS